MKVDVPFQVEYLTPDAVPIDEVIDSLIAIRTMLRESTSTIPSYYPAIKVESVQIKVRQISHDSPLRELFLVSLVIAFQEDLTKTLPPLIEEHTGVAIPENLHTLVTVATMIAVYYGIGYVKDLLLQKQLDSPVRKQLSALIKELSGMTGKPEKEIRRVLEERYKPKGKMKELGRQAIRFFMPSKSQGNAPILIDKRKIGPEIVEDVPREFAYDEELETSKSRDFYDVPLEIHAQDRDKSKTGWAALVKGEMEKRVPMKLSLIHI